MNKGTGKIANFLVLAVSLVVGVLLTELLVRWVAPQELTPLGAHDPTGLRIIDSRFGLVLKPNFDGLWARDVVVQVNSLGLRDKEYGPKERNEIRILSLGDS